MLDSVCKTLSESREEEKEIRSTEKQAKASGLARMIAKSYAEYKAHGIRLTRVSGDDKLLVKVVDDDSGADDVEDVEDAEDVKNVELEEAAGKE